MSGAPRVEIDADASAQRPRVILAHAGSVISGAAKQILGAHGFDVAIADAAEAVDGVLDAGGGADALVLDVALPGGFELITPARRAGVRCVILVASVFRRTSYKRRPQRLYGADDYVEIHHLGDHLPARLRRHLGMGPSRLPSDSLREVLATVNDHGDQRLLQQSPRGLAMLIVADVLLYNGDRIQDAADVDQALAAVADDLAGARELFAQLVEQLADRQVADSPDLIDACFRELVGGLERGEPSSSPESEAST